MNRSMVRFLISRLLLIEAALLLIPLIVAFIYQESWTNKSSFLIPMLILVVLGSLGNIVKPKNYHIYTKEGMLIVALCWVLWSAFGAIPFVLSGQIPSFIDAFFETSSGFTTTGATILDDVTVLSHSMHFWRAFTHLIGGMGVLVFALAIMKNSKNSHLEVMRAEMPGPVFAKIVSKLKDTAQILYIVYLVLATILGIVLYFAGMPLFDSIITAMSTAGTGGFALYNESIGHYNSQLINYIVAIGMLVFGVNFNLYIYILMRKFKAFFADEELRYYFMIIAGSTLILFVNIFSRYQSAGLAFGDAFFQVATTISSTGFGLGPFYDWPMFSQYILMALMFIGGCAGSTAGGFKLIRVMVLGRVFKNQIRNTLYPSRVLSLHVNGSVVDKATQHSIMKYFTVYTVLLFLLMGVLSFDSDNFLTIASSALSCFNNMGPILGSSSTFSFYSPLSKFVLSFAMIAGRLEIYPVILLFMRRTWSNF